MKLIEITRLLDQARLNEYAGQRTVKQLITNINVLIDSMDEPLATTPGSFAERAGRAAKVLMEKPK